MKLRDRLGISAERQRQVTRLLQAALGAIVLYGLVRRDLKLLVNAALPLAVTFLPALLERDYSVQMDAGLTLWLATAALLHAAGAVWLYDAFSWFDQLAHAVSASLVGGVGYAVAQALDHHSRAVQFPERLLAAYVVVFVLAFGVLWELLEFASEGLSELVGGEAVLAQHGIDDVVMDFIFNAVGAVVVAVGATGFFEDVAGSVGRMLSRSE